MINRIAIFSLSALAVLAIIYLGYKNYTSLQEQLQAQQRANALLQVAADESKINTDKLMSTVNAWSIEQTNYHKDLAELRAVAVSSRQSLEKLNDVLSKHDIELLAAKKPKLIEKRINAGTADAFRMLECASGADYEYCADGSAATE